MGWLETTVKNDPSSTAIDSFLDCVEVSLAGSRDELFNLIGIGFVEHLASGGPEGQRVIDELCSRMGPSTRAEFRSLSEHRRESAALRKQFGRCRCNDLREVSGPGIIFYSEHLVWVNEYGTGLNGFSCAATGSFWLRTDSRGGYEPRMERFEFEEVAEGAAKALRNQP